MKILVFAPHPDDEVLGCGGTIAKYADSGAEVSLCRVTKAYEPDWCKSYSNKSRRVVYKAASILGINKVYFLGFPTVKLDTIPRKTLNDKITACIKKVKPEVVYAPYRNDVNLDHKIVFDSVMVAVRPIDSNSRRNSVKKVLSCEILSETDWAIPSQTFKPNVYIDITNTLAKKIEAMKAYDFELKEYPHSRSLRAITALAEKRGVEVGLEAAEAFELIKEVIV